MQNEENAPIELPEPVHTNPKGTLIESPLWEYNRWREPLFFVYALVLGLFVFAVNLLILKTTNFTAVFVAMIASWLIYSSMILAHYKYNSRALAKELLEFHRPSFEKQAVKCACQLGFLFKEEIRLQLEMLSCEDEESQEVKGLREDMERCRTLIVDAKARFRNAVRVLRAVGASDSEASFEYKKWVKKYEQQSSLTEEQPQRREIL